MFFIFCAVYFTQNYTYYTIVRRENDVSANHGEFHTLFVQIFVRRDETQYILFIYLYFEHNNNVCDNLKYFTAYSFLDYITKITVKHEFIVHFIHRHCCSCSLFLLLF